jgi:hypothetical protein
MLTTAERRAKRRTIESILRVRRANLAILAGLNDNGWAGLGRRLGVSAQHLVNMAGPNPTRPVSEKTARSFENLLRLPDGWLDKPQRLA